MTGPHTVNNRQVVEKQAYQRGFEEGWSPWSRLEKTWGFFGIRCWA